MRDDYAKDPQGRSIRIKHVVLEDREGEQIPIWVDYKIITRDQMVMSLQGRRKQIVGDCIQLKNDVDSYNENRNTGSLSKSYLISPSIWRRTNWQRA